MYVLYQKQVLKLSQETTVGRFCHYFPETKVINTCIKIVAVFKNHYPRSLIAVQIRNVTEYQTFYCLFINVERKYLDYFPNRPVRQMSCAVLRPRGMEYSFFYKEKLRMTSAQYLSQISPTVSQPQQSTNKIHQANLHKR